MADTGSKISALPAAAALDGSEAVPVVQGGATKKATTSQITAFVKTGISAADVGAIPVAEKGAANGVASLDGAGIVPAAQLPSYVDDVVEGYYYEGAFYSDAAHTQELTGETGKIYVDLPSSDSYRWGGSAYVKIANPITVDDALSGSSTNPVQNRIITAATQELQRIALGAYPTETASGAVASVDDGADDIPVKELTVTIPLTQSGSGTPSPDNGRPITGFTGVTISQSGADTSQSEDTSVSWQSVAGSVYVGSLALVSGVLSAGWIEAQGTVGVYQVSAGAVVASLSISNAGGKTLSGVVSSHFSSEIASGVGRCSLSGSTIYFILPRTAAPDGTSEQVQAWLQANGVVFLVQIAPADTWQIGGTELRTRLGINNFWTDVGDVSVDYRADPAMYIDKRLQALGG